MPPSMYDPGRKDVPTLWAAPVRGHRPSHQCDGLLWELARVTTLAVEGTRLTHCPAWMPLQGPYMVAYADTNCSGTVITGMDYPYFGGEEVPADVSSVSTFLRVRTV